MFGCLPQKNFLPSSSPKTPKKSSKNSTCPRFYHLCNNWFNHCATNKSNSLINISKDWMWFRILQYNSRIRVLYKPMTWYVLIFKTNPPFNKTIAIIISTKKAQEIWYIPEKKRKRKKNLSLRNRNGLSKQVMNELRIFYLTFCKNQWRISNCCRKQTTSEQLQEYLDSIKEHED